MGWMFIIVLTVILSLNGCAKDASGGDEAVSDEKQEVTERDASASDETIWIAIVLTWRPVIYTIDKEFSSEVDCWNYYEEGVGESKFGTQHLDHQGNKPDAEYMKKHRPLHREYPTRLYHGITDEQGQVWLTCDIKGRIEGL